MYHSPENSIMLTATDKALIRESAAAIEAHAGRASDVFYTTLFTLEPAIRPLFPDDMEGQKKKFISMITLFADYANQLGALLPLIVELGNQHKVIGAKEQDYQLVLTALQTAFREIFPPEHADEMITSWTAYYRVIASIMTAE